MQLQGRELKIRMKGKAVTLLQQELIWVGYQIHEAEQAKKDIGCF
jgi:hypothetical protein